VKAPRLRPPSDPAIAARKARDAGLILPLVGLLLLMPPFGRIFAIDATVMGVPLVVGYAFAVWAALIVAAFLLSRRLAVTEPALHQSLTAELADAERAEAGAGGPAQAVPADPR
jgi:hypothetical protein